MRILTLTDHQTHGPGESIYRLLVEISHHKLCNDVSVASRTVAGNESFFKTGGGRDVLARRVGDDFAFSQDGDWFQAPMQRVSVDAFDVVFLRVDRPVSSDLLADFSTRFAGRLIVNDPSGIQETGSKEFLQRFAEYCAPMKLCTSVEQVREFCRETASVIKPLQGYGGKGLARIDGAKAWIEAESCSLSQALSHIETLINSDGAVLVNQFLPTIHLGDKRVVVVNGEIVGAMLRKPAESRWLANLSQGGTSTFADVEPEELAMAEAISPTLEKKGIAIFGFDTLVGLDDRRVLSEINTLNVGGFLQAEQHSGKPVVARTANLLMKYFADRV